MVDQHGDNHGYMVLRIPAKELSTGSHLRIKVTGSQANLTSWYMTFKKAVKTGVDSEAFPCNYKKGSSQLQLVKQQSFISGMNLMQKYTLMGSFSKRHVLNLDIM